MRVRFVVFEKDIKSGLVLFYKVRFQHQCLDLVIDDNELEICNDLDQLFRLRVLMPARLEILPDTIAKVLCLAHVNDLAGGILMDINTGAHGQGFEFFGDRHYLKFTTKERRTQR